MEPAVVAGAAREEEEGGWPPPSLPPAPPPAIRQQDDGATPEARNNWKGRLLVWACLAVIVGSIVYAGRVLADGRGPLAKARGQAGAGLSAAAVSPSQQMNTVTAARDGGAGGAAGGGRTAVPMSVAEQGSEMRSPASTSSDRWPPPASKQQQAAGAGVPTRAPSIAPARSSNSTVGGAKAVPEAMSVLDVLQALQQGVLESDKKYITTDYFGNEIPKEKRPGQFAHLTGAPTPTIVDDGAPVCHVENSVELRQAIMFKSCPLITMAPISNDIGELEQSRDDDDPLVEGEVDESHANDGAYHIFTEILITRDVTLQGDPVMMPLIDCQLSVRCFRVRAGGRLNARYVQMNQGKGEVEPRFPDVDMDMNADLPGPLGNKINVVRGGTVLYEPGTTGGTYFGCFFLGDEGTEDEVEEAIERSFGVLGIRIYGGHFFIAGGRLDFIGCLFYDFEILTPMTDRLRFGDDIFMLGGEVYMTGCNTLYTSLIGVDMGVGLNIHVQAGALFMTGCNVVINNGVSFTATVGQVIFVGGGLLIFTASNAMFNSGVETFNGFGAFATMGGAQIITASAIQDFYGILGAFGIGFDLGLGVGVVVTTNCGINQFLGLVYAGMLGGFACNLAGIYIAEHSPFVSIVSQGSEAGGGGYFYNAAGLSSVHFSSVFSTAGTWGSFMAGVYVGQPAGWLVWIYSPIVGISGVECYYGGVGGSIFVGAGAAVMGRSPLLEFNAVVNLHADFWIMGSCEPYIDAWADGPITLFVGGQGCNVSEAAEMAFEMDPADIKSGRVGGEWVGKLERFRHENHMKREEKKHGGGGEGNHSEGGRHRAQRWVGRKGRGRQRRRLEDERVPVVRVAQQNEEEGVTTDGSSFAPLGASFNKPAFLGYNVSPLRRRSGTSTVADAAADAEETAPLADAMDDEVVAAVFAPNTLEVMRVIQAKYQAIKQRINSGDGSAIEPVTVHLQRTPEGFCGVCGVDSVEGPGAGACAVQRHCDADFTSFAALALEEASPIVGKRLFGDSAVAVDVVSPPVVPAAAEAAAEVVQFPSPSAFDALPDGTKRALEASLTAPIPDSEGASGSERFVLTAKIDVGTDPDYPRLNMTHIADAVYAALGRNVADPLHPLVGDEVVQVQVVSGGVEDEVFASWYPEMEGEKLLRYRSGGEEGREGPGDFDVQRFKAIIISKSRLQARRALHATGQDPGARIRHLQQDDERIEGADGVVEGRDVGDGEAAEDWGQAIESYLHSVGAAGVRAVAVGLERSVYIPPYDTKLFLQEAGPAPGTNGVDLGNYAVLLTDPAAAAFTVQQDVAYTKEYEVRLSGFPALSVVTVQALKVDAEQEEELARPMVTVSTDEEGKASFKWRFFPLGFPEGDYVVKATVVKTGAIGLSLLYSLTKTGPRRRLIGPRMWI